MKPELLYKIADVINANSNIYHAVVPYSKFDYMIQEGSRLVRSSCYVLRIMLSGKVKCHVSRTVWNIFEIDMDKIIQKVCRRDKAFAERIAKCEPTPLDVELLIRRASFKTLMLQFAKSSISLYIKSDN